MARILGNIAKKGKEKFTQRDSKLNFVVPKNNISYYGIEWKKDDRNLALDKDNFCFQIGKMDKKNETLYTKEFLAGALDYLLHKVGLWQKITIQIRKDLADILTNKDDDRGMKEVLLYEQEKKEIEKIIKKYFKEHMHKVDIVSVADQYPEVFSLLEKKWVVGLQSDKEIVLDPQSFSPLDIARYLYAISKKDGKFMITLYATKPEEQKKMDTLPIGENESDYYAMIEVAIRLYEILKGKNIQWGAIRQIRYDRIIWMLLYGKDSKDKDYSLDRFPELLKFHNFCKQINPNVQFERLYIDNTQIQKVEDKKIERKGTIKKLAIYTGLVSSLLLWALWGAVWTSSYIKHQKEKENKEKEIALLASKLKAKKLQSGYHYSFQNHTTMESKLGMLDVATNNVYYELLKAYKIKNTSEEEIKALIKNELLKWNNLNDVSMDIERITKIANDFISNVLIPNNTVLLNQWWCDLLPYKDMKQYQKYFNETTNFQGDLTIDWEVDPMANGDNSYYINPTKENDTAIHENNLPQSTKCYFEKVMDEYEDAYWVTYSVMVVSTCERRENDTYQLDRKPPITKQYIVASHTTGMINKTYSLELWKKIIADITSRRAQAEKALEKSK